MDYFGTRTVGFASGFKPQSLLEVLGEPHTMLEIKPEIAMYKTRALFPILSL